MRGPFRTLHCPSHSWERYDCQRAGCLLCGCSHECSADVASSACPLAHLDDGEVCCTITGYCLPVVRYGKNEFVDHAVMPEERGSGTGTEVERLSDEVYSVVEWFLLGRTSVECKENEVGRVLSRFQSVIVKELKQHKMQQARDGLRTLPCLPAILAQAVHQIHPRQSRRASLSLCRYCAQHITKCILNLNMAASTQNKRVSVVVGLLYLMKQGLTIQNVQWLPRVPSLSECLPHETCLEKTFKLSMKLVCETENEVKLALRQRVKLL